MILYTTKAALASLINEERMELMSPENERTKLSFSA